MIDVDPVLHEIAQRVDDLWQDRASAESMASKDAIVAVLSAQLRDAKNEASNSKSKARQARRLGRMVTDLRNSLNNIHTPHEWWDFNVRDYRSLWQGRIGRRVEDAKRQLYAGVPPTSDHISGGKQFAGDALPADNMSALCWAMISLAGEYVRAAEAVKVWNSTILDEQGLRVDLEEQLGGLTRQLIDTADLYRDLGPVPGGTTPAEHHVRDLHGSNVERVNTALDWAYNRLRALRAYAGRLAEIQRLDDAVARAAELERLEFRADELVAASGADELGANEIDQSSRGVSDLLNAQEHAWALLRGDYLAVAERDDQPSLPDGGV